MILIFHSGTKEKDGKIVTDGGRVLSVTAIASDLPTAIKEAYQRIKGNK